MRTEGGLRCPSMIFDNNDRKVATNIGLIEDEGLFF